MSEQQKKVSDFFDPSFWGKAVAFVCGFACVTHASCDKPSHHPFSVPVQRRDFENSYHGHLLGLREEFGEGAILTYNRL